MFDQDGQVILKIGTSTNMNSPNTLFKRQHRIYLVNSPFNNKKPLLDNFTVLYFLATFDKDQYTFTQTQKIANPKKIDNQYFTHFLIISQNKKNLFRIYYQECGNYFVIQILNIDENIKYKETYVKLNKKERKVFIYDNPIIKSDNLNSIQIQVNRGISELSDFYNNKSVERSKRNQITAALFYDIAPFDPKTINRNIHKIMNPDDSIEGIFNNFGGTLFKFHSNEQIDLNEFPFGIFAWLTSYLFDIVNSEYFDYATTIELDATFQALSPYKICIPLLIYRNSGIPLGILASPSEKVSLYSLFFEALKKLDQEFEIEEKENSLFFKFQKKKYLCDEHKSFPKLSKKYNLEFYNCFVHLIRSIGSNSLLGLLLSEILYTFSAEEWSNNFLKYYNIFKKLYEIRTEKDEYRFDKVSQVLGINISGESIPIKKQYSPLFIRKENIVPTSTNHIESFHKQINTIVRAPKLSIHLKLAYIIKYINDRILRCNINARNNLKEHFHHIISVANNAVSKNKKLKSNYSKDSCACERYWYYSCVYNLCHPCIHCILNKDFDLKYYIEQMKERDMKFPSYSDKINQLKVFDLDTDLKFLKKKKVHNNNEDDENDEINVNTNFQKTMMDFYIEHNECKDTLEKIIENTEHQLANIISKHNLNYTVVAVSVQRELYRDPITAKLEEENKDAFYALFQIRLWYAILEGRETIKV